MKKEWIFVSLIMSIVFATSPTWADSPAQKDGAVALPSIHFERLGDSTISAEAVSRDGLTVAGEGSSVFRWKKYEGLEFLDFDGRPQGISDDGSVIVGSIGARLFRWSESGGFENLGTIGWGEYADVSADGSVISAIITNPIGFNEAIRLDPDGITGLGYIRNDDYIMNWSKASGISADGSVIVGFGNGGGMAEAWRWTKSGGIQGLGGLGRSAYNGHAFDVSTDGSIIVGDESDQAFIWTEDTGMTGLGKISESRRERSCASAVSADGSVVVGLSWGFSGYEAFIWEEEIGMLSLNEVLCDNGFDLDGFMLVRANGVSDDGRTIAGKGVNKERGPEGWVLVLPERGALTGLEISGPTEISENSIAVYKALAKFENGYSLNVASTAVWSVDALNDMEIEKNGLLNTESVDKPQQMTISASWAIDEVTVEAELTVEFDWYVPETLQVPGEFETIQDAINASQNRDIVLVADGTYTGNGNHNIEVGDKVITVRSENGPENCIIDCEGSGEDGRCGFIFRGRENNDCTVDGFTISIGDNC